MERPTELIMFGVEIWKIKLEGFGTLGIALHFVAIILVYLVMVAFI